MKFTANKFALYGMISASISIVLSLIFGSVGVLPAIIAIGLGLKGIIDYSRHKELGGALGAVSAIILGIIFTVLFGVGFLKLASEVPGKVLTGCGPADEIGNEDCYLQLALDKSNPSYCRQLREVYNSNCISKYAVKRNDLELCRSLLKVWPEEYGVNCLIGLAAVRKDVALCNEIRENYNEVGSTTFRTKDNAAECMKGITPN